MNAVTKLKPAPAPAVEQDASTKAPAVLEALHERFGKIIALARRRSSDDCRDWINKNPAPAVPAWLRFKSDPEQILKFRNQEIERSHEILRRLPTPELLMTQVEDLHRAVFSPATDREIRLIVAALVDAIPHASSTAGAGFVESVIFSIKHDDDDSPEWESVGYSLPVLFLAVQRISRSSKFCPAIVEILEEARKSREMFYSAWRATDSLFDITRSAEEIIADIDMPADGDEGEDFP